MYTDWASTDLKSGEVNGVEEGEEDRIPTNADTK